MPGAGMTFQVRAVVRVERGTALACACGGKLERVPGGWECADCGKGYE